MAPRTAANTQNQQQIDKIVKLFNMLDASDGERGAAIPKLVRAIDNSGMRFSSIFTFLEAIKVTTRPVSADDVKALKEAKVELEKYIEETKVTLKDFLKKIDEASRESAKLEVELDTAQNTCYKEKCALFSLRNMPTPRNPNDGAPPRKSPVKPQKKSKSSAFAAKSYQKTKNKTLADQYPSWAQFLAKMDKGGQEAESALRSFHLELKSKGLRFLDVIEPALIEDPLKPALETLNDQIELLSEQINQQIDLLEERSDALEAIIAHNHMLRNKVRAAHDQRKDYADQVREIKGKQPSSPSSNGSSPYQQRPTQTTYTQTTTVSQGSGQSGGQNTGQSGGQTGGSTGNQGPVQPPKKPPVQPPPPKKPTVQAPKSKTPDPRWSIVANEITDRINNALNWTRSPRVKQSAFRGLVAFAFCINIAAGVGIAKQKWNFDAFSISSWESAWASLTNGGSPQPPSSTSPTASQTATTPPRPQEQPSSSRPSASQGYSSSSQEDSSQELYVAFEPISLWSHTGINKERRGKLHLGDKVRVSSVNYGYYQSHPRDWVYVHTANGQSGFVMGTQLSTSAPSQPSEETSSEAVRPPQPGSAKTAYLKKAFVPAYICAGEVLEGPSGITDSSSQIEACVEYYSSQEPNTYHTLLCLSIHGNDGEAYATIKPVSDIQQIIYVPYTAVSLDRSSCKQSLTSKFDTYSFK